MNYSAIDYNQLYSPQFDATRYNNRPQYVPIEEINRGLSGYLPDIYDIQRAREAQEVQNQLEQEKLGIQQNQARWGTGIELAGLGVQSAASPTIRKAAISGWKNFGFHPMGEQVASNVVPKVASLPSIPLEPTMENLGAPIVNAGYNAPLGKLYEGTGEQIGQSVAQQTGRSALGTLASYASPAGWGSIAGNIAQAVIPGKQRYKTLGGAASGALAGTYIMPGIGTAIGAIFGGISASTKKCIITTCLYGVDSTEVDICRQYRDRHFDKEMLRGYYAYSEPVVELMEKYPEVKEYYKTKLAEPLLRFARFKLGYTKIHPSPYDCAIALNYTNLWRDIGSTMKSFKRANGEVV